MNYILFVLKFTSDNTFVLKPITHHHTQQLINFPDWNTYSSPHLLAIKSCFWISVIKLKVWKSETSISTCKLNVYETFFLNWNHWKKSQCITQRLQPIFCQSQVDSIDIFVEACGTYFASRVSTLVLSAETSASSSRLKKKFTKWKRNRIGS